MQSATPREKKYFSRYRQPLVDLPNLVEAQLNSYKWLLTEGLKEVFKEFSPIKDYSGKKFELTIERGIEIMAEDEYLEITPKAVRLRKQYLTKTERDKARRKERKEF